MRNVILFLAMTVLFGCSAIQGNKLGNDISNYIEVVDGICGTEALFDALDKEFPGKEACEMVVKAKDLIQPGGDAFEAIKVLQCTEHNLKSPEFKTCILDESRNWWPIMADRIIREAEKLKL